jgi:diaminopimelate epimerase
VRFVKMQASGNDFVCIDGFVERPPAHPGEAAKRICDRRLGVGADGLMLIEPSEGAHARMIVWNADGSRADMCGNALRCVAVLLQARGRARDATLRILTDQGPLDAHFVDAASGRRLVRTRIGTPVLEPARVPFLGATRFEADLPFSAAGRTWPVTVLSFGNPHCVVFTSGLDGLDVPGIGREIETHPDFPKRVNVSFVEVVSREEICQRTWERGVGETSACGTGASAACVAGVLSGRTSRRVLAHVRGGDLELEWPEDDGPVWLTGPAAIVFEGEIG